MGDPTRHLRRGSAEKRLSEFFLDNGKSGVGTLFSHFLDGILSLWMPPQEPAAARPHVADAINLYSKEMALEEPFADILGNVYMTLGSRGGRAMLGQFFTPPEIAEMLAQMNEIGDRPLPTERLTRIYDPTCGSGALLLGAIRVLIRKRGVIALNLVHIVGTDLDSICARMAAVQIVAGCNLHRFDLGAIDIDHGDSLRMETIQRIISASSLRPHPGLQRPTSESSAVALEVVESG